MVAKVITALLIVIVTAKIIAIAVVIVTVNFMLQVSWLFSC
jgi:hypothetical protein